MKEPHTAAAISFGVGEDGGAPSVQEKRQNGRKVGRQSFHHHGVVALLWFRASLESSPPRPIDSGRASLKRLATLSVL